MHLLKPKSGVWRTQRLWETYGCVSVWSGVDALVNASPVVYVMCSANVYQVESSNQSNQSLFIPSKPCRGNDTTDSVFNRRHRLFYADCSSTAWFAMVLWQTCGLEHTTDVTWFTRSSFYRCSVPRSNTCRIESDLWCTSCARSDREGFGSRLHKQNVL